MMKKTVKLWIAYILTFCLLGTTSAAAVSEEAVAELLYENEETYITSYNLETGEQYVSKLSDLIGENNVAAYADQDDITVPAVPPRNGPSWPTAEEGVSPQFVYSGSPIYINDYLAVGIVSGDSDNFNYATRILHPIWQNGCLRLEHEIHGKVC